MIRETPQHQERPKDNNIDGATRHDNSMVATQHGSSTKHGTNIIGHRQQHKGQEGRDAKQPQVSVRVSRIASLNEEMEIKLSSLRVFLQLVPVASCSEQKRGAIQVHLYCICIDTTVIK